MSDWKKSFQEDKELILISTGNDNIPHGNIVMSIVFLDNKILIADCQMKKTIRNLQENNCCCIISDYIRIKGNVEIFDSWKYFELCVKRNSYPVKNAILINITEVFNLDKVEKIEI